MLRKVVLGSSALTLVPIIRAASPVEDEESQPPEKDKQAGVPVKPPPMRVSDLPIYDAPHAKYAEYVNRKKPQEQNKHIRSLIQEPITTVRAQVQTVLEQTDNVTSSVKDNYNEYAKKTDWMVRYLREEDNKDVRYGAVVLGGLTGFIFGLRGGFIRRVLYTGVGSGFMSAVCFPEETREFSRTNGALAKQYINIAYNFLYGIKPGDPQLELKLPELTIPKDFSELVDMTVSVTSSVAKAVLPPSKEKSDVADAAGKEKPAEKKD